MVLTWNALLREATQRDSANAKPGYSTRAMAMMNGAIYDCLQAIQRTHQPFHVNITASATASRKAAIASAGYRVATALYPAEDFFLYWGFRNSTDGIPASAEKTAGVALGEAVAAAYVSWRQGDGYMDSVPYQPTPGPGRWRSDPTQVFIQEPVGPVWGAMDPFCIAASSQFPVPRAPALTSQAYTDAFLEVKAYGDSESSVRTVDQFYVGKFWAYDRSGLGPPSVLYNRNLAEICASRGSSEAANARLFAMASVAMADAAICAWDVKFIDDLWRPVTAVREADTDGNPDTIADPEWTPTGCPGGNFPDFTPPFPAYVSGHATMGEATFQTLKRFYGLDQMNFTLTSEELPGKPRSYTSLTQAAQENADSRVWLGVHWRFDQMEGQALGASVADYVYSSAFTPVLETYADFAGVHALSVNGQGDKDQDGIKDFAEYAFNTHPRRADSPPGAVVKTISGMPCIVLPYTCSPAHTTAGLTLSVERSSDLVTWTTDGVMDTLDPERASNSVMQCRRACVPILPGPPVFLRLKANQ